MAYDNNLLLQASTTQTATYSSTGINLGNPSNTTGTNVGGTPRRGLKALVDVTAISGAPTVTFKIQHSDNDSTWYDLAYEENGAGFSASTGVDYISFETSKQWVRLVMTLTGGTSPSITYAAYISEVRSG